MKASQMRKLKMNLFCGFGIAHLILLCTSGTNHVIGQPPSNDPYLVVLHDWKSTWDQIAAEKGKLPTLGLSYNQEFYLQLAIEKIFTATDKTFLATFQNLYSKRKISGVPVQRLDSLETRMIEINRQLKFWKNYGTDQHDHGILPEEIKYYNPEPGEKIGEIGGGSGQFALFMASQTNHTTIYFNERDPIALQNAKFGFQQISNTLASRDVALKPILGTSQSTGMEGLELDKIILRNTFHHFDYPEIMLASIRSSLSPTGRLFLLERFDEDCDTGCCPKLMDWNDLITMTTKAGFFLTTKKIILAAGQEKWNLLRFEKKAGD